jgi:hypothetical protein
MLLLLLLLLAPGLRDLLSNDFLPELLKYSFLLAFAYAAVV